MNKITVLDCTLRDGGYVNNWDFGKESIISICKKLANAGIETIECGFISQTKVASENMSVYRTPAEAELYLPKCNNLSFAAMINFGEYNIDEFPKYNGGSLKAIRVAFHKNDMVDAIEFCKKIKQLGYDVYVQPMVTQNYTADELMFLINESNNFLPKAFYIVDSFGTMKKNEVLSIYNVIKENLSTSIAIGFHSHNNMQLSFSNAQELMKLDCNHEIIIDSSVYGMGRGAGNLCTELITKYINDNYYEKYDLIPILEIIDEHIMQIFIKTPWGYSVPFYIGSINNCHPNYALFLLDKQTLSVKDIHKILSNMDEDKKVMFDKEYILKLYEEYQSKLINDSDTIKMLKDVLDGRNILVIAPGKTITDEREKIDIYCKQTSPLIFSVNFIPDNIDTDFVFIGNQKRYKNIINSIKNEQVILTSNINCTDKENIKLVNYADLITEDESITDNSGMMLLNLFKRLNVSSVALAGFDGLSINRMNNYYQEKLVSGSSVNELIKMNDAISKKIKSLTDTLGIKFITTSLYNK